jgi:hypothetical protein
MLQPIAPQSIQIPGPRHLTAQFCSQHTFWSHGLLKGLATANNLKRVHSGRMTGKPEGYGWLGEDSA